MQPSGTHTLQLQMSSRREAAPSAHPGASSGADRAPNPGIPFRLRIGVTGHRDLADSEGVADLVRRQLLGVLEALPGTDSTPVVVTLLSALAPGADQLVARIVLDTFAEHEVELQAVLPMGAEEYLGTFDAPGDFHDLLDAADTVIVLSPSNSRHEAYARAGHLVVDHSDLLIALWDGRPARGPGGTAEIVDYARREGVGVLVAQVLRASAAGDIDPAPALPDERAQLERLQRDFGYLDAFNRSMGVATKSTKSVSERRHELLAFATPPLRARVGRACDWALPGLSRASGLAMGYQSRYRRLGEVLFALSALAVAIVAAQAEWGGPDQLVLLEVACMVGLLAIYVFARRLRMHERWLGYRALAEAFRAGLFVLVAEDPMPASRSARPATIETDALSAESSGGGEGWYQRAFVEAWRRRPVLPEPVGCASQLAEFIIKSWIAPQIRYHETVIERCESRRRWLTVAVLSLFGAALVAGTLHGLDALPGASWRHVLIFTALALPGFGAAIVGVRDQRQYSLHADRSRRTCRRLEHLRFELGYQASLGGVRRLIGDAQRLLSDETIDWSIAVELQRLEVVL